MKRSFGTLFSIPKLIIVFICTFVVYHIIFSSFFPVDENNVLQAPDSYVFIGMAVSLAVAFFAARKRKINTKRFLKTSESKKEALYQNAVACVKKRGFASQTALERDLNIDFSVANDLMDRMKAEGLIAQNERGLWVPATGYRFGADIPVSVNASMFEQQNGLRISDVDCMEGHDFEYWCADLLRKLGYQDVEVTPGSGDQGVDILAEKEGIRYAVQCKCYSSNLGNTPIQEVHAGKKMYHCQIGAVMTNRYFTQGGRELAETTGVLLWDRDWLIGAIEKTLDKRPFSELVEDAQARASGPRHCDSSGEDTRERELGRPTGRAKEPDQYEGR